MGEGRGEGERGRGEEEGGRGQKAVGYLDVVCSDKRSGVERRELNGEKTTLWLSHSGPRPRAPRQEVSTNTAVRVRKQTAAGSDV